MSSIAAKATLFAHFVRAQDLFLASVAPRVSESQCTFEEDTDHFGGEYKVLPVSSAEECCAACSDEAERCVVAVFFQNVCYMKDVINEGSSSNGCVSTKPSSSPTPSPTPPVPSPTPPVPSPSPVPSQCTVLQDTDYTGGDYASAPADSAEACCNACAADSACRAGVFFQGVCYLKNSIALVASSEGRIAVIAGSSPTPPPPPSPPSPPPPTPPIPKGNVEWKVVRGSASADPQLLLNVGEGFSPFQLRGVDYSPIAKCCGNNDASAFHKPFWTRDIPRMAASGVNVIKLYGMCDGILDGSNYCGAPEAGCERSTVSQASVIEFLNFCYEHHVFVLLSNRASPGNLDAYDHMSATYGAHPAVAGIIMYDETLDLNNFNAASKIVHENICNAFGKDPATTPVEESGRIITTAAQNQIPTADFQSKYGEHVNVWGFDPYDQWDYNRWHDFSVPFKPYVIMENGINGAGNAGCRTDCTSGACTACSDFSTAWKSYVSWMETARLAGHIIFEWTDENWKGGRDSCNEVRTSNDGSFNEANHGILRVAEDGSLESKSIGNSETFESVLASSWTRDGPGPGGFYGWL